MTSPSEIAVGEAPSPIGELLCGFREGVLCSLEFADHRSRFDVALHRRFGAVRLRAQPVPRTLRDRLAAYFAGELAAIDGIPVALGGTPFQSAVWAALRRIPAGTTATYAALAAALGRPEAIRAVGAANGSNPVSIIVPCHRLVGADGSLTGYGGGIERKSWLLVHEGARTASP